MKGIAPRFIGEGAQIFKFQFNRIKLVLVAALQVLKMNFSIGDLKFLNQKPGQGAGRRGVSLFVAFYSLRHIEIAIFRHLELQFR